MICFRIQNDFIGRMRIQNIGNGIVLFPQHCVFVGSVTLDILGPLLLLFAQILICPLFFLKV